MRRSGVLVPCCEARRKEVNGDHMISTNMTRAEQLLLTASTLTLAKQIQVEAAVAGNPISQDDAIVQAVHLIQLERVPLTDWFVVRY